MSAGILVMITQQKLIAMAALKINFVLSRNAVLAKSIIAHLLIRTWMYANRLVQDILDTLFLYFLLLYFLFILV